jgi:hypothetical protein
VPSVPLCGSMMLSQPSGERAYSGIAGWELYRAEKRRAYAW